MTKDLEQQRVYRHLQSAEQFARMRGARAKGFSGVQRLVRGLLLDELTRYRLAGRYPQNRDFRNHSAPYFVDEDGTRCAVAHLLEVGGRPDLVQKIAARRNHARVRELADEPELVQFLADAGLTLEEAARIQPKYCWYPSDCVCSARAESVVEATVLTRAGLMLTARIDAVFGESPRAQVGDELALNDTAKVGEQVWIAIRPTDASSEAYILPFRLSSDSVACKHSEAILAQEHSLPKDVAYRAVSSPSKEACESVLTDYSIGWTHPQCDAGCGCRFGPAGDPALPAIGSVAIAVALLRRRRQRALSAPKRRTRTNAGS